MTIYFTLRIFLQHKIIYCLSVRGVEEQVGHRASGENKETFPGIVQPFVQMPNSADSD